MIFYPIISCTPGVLHDQHSCGCRCLRDIGSGMLEYPGTSLLLSPSISISRIQKKSWNGRAPSSALMLASSVYTNRLLAAPLPLSQNLYTHIPKSSTQLISHPQPAHPANLQKPHHKIHARPATKHDAPLVPSRAPLRNLQHNTILPHCPPGSTAGPHVPVPGHMGADETVSQCHRYQTEKYIVVCQRSGAPVSRRWTRRGGGDIRSPCGYPR